MEKLRTRLEALHRVEEEAHCFSGQVSALEEELGLTRNELDQNRKVGNTLGRIIIRLSTDAAVSSSIISLVLDSVMRFIPGTTSGIIKSIISTRN